jgi:hypothetical protein
MIRIFSDVSSARYWWMRNQRDLFPALPHSPTLENRGR